MVEENKQLANEDRLPPGQKLLDKLPVLQYGGIPQGIDLESWRLRIWGCVKAPVSLTWKEFDALPKVERTLDLHCVTRWSNYDTHWSGVTLQSMLEAGVIELLPNANYVVQHAAGYSTSLPLAQMTAENFLLATHYEGERITLEHGWPLRGLTGAMPDQAHHKDVYLWKGAKWLNGLEFTEADKLGFWERSGYHNEADVWKEQRFAENL